MCSKSKICADCGATEPRWGILNKGVLVCDACCSVHRSLGRHISQVRYLDKGTWPPSLYNLLMTLANGGANCLWEHSLCELKCTKKKPTHSDPLHPIKSEFIKAKYEHLAYHLKSCDTEEDLSQQLHSSVRTSNLETSLRLLSQGADPNYFYKEKGNRPLHVAATAGQILQLELLMIYGADPHRQDNKGNSPIKLSATDEIYNRLTQCMYEASDRLIHYLTGMIPDHANNHHYILPHAQSSRSEARHKLMKLSNTLLEDLVQDVYDEIDRRETEKLWQTLSHSISYNAVPLGVPFLPVNRSLSTMRNQGRQKLARLSDEDFNTLVTDIIYIAVQRSSPSEKLQRKLLLDEEPLYDSVASDEELQTPTTPTSMVITNKQTQLESKLMISEAHITHLNNEIAKLKTQVQQVLAENDSLRAVLRNGVQQPETEPVSESSSSLPQRPASMYNVTLNNQSTTTTMPQSEEVVRRTDQVTKRIQELAAHMRSSDKCHSFVPHAERIRIAVSELTAIFPQSTSNDLIRHALRSLNTSTVRLQAECAQLEGSAERVRSCAYNMAKANKQLLTQFQ